jgi:transcriptional regulator with XRE-family HTH domain
MTVNEKIKVLRKKRGLSQQQLADMVGIHITHMSRIENGHNLPSLDVFKRLIDIFAVSPEYLLYNDAEEGDFDVQDRSLFERIRLLDKLEDKDRQALIQIIDTMLTKQRMRELLAESA